ncbi:methyltransferase [Lentzea flava]|uniref:Methyltransferase n=2 Tax=Lentzea flava TaxID=103732 RepID=A0ABQ2ULV4_9PSEU|nr:Methyltransferase domain-containing protein [Lentzea flava]GGU43489.1 methyltransferase [Lentzea flava]
MKPYVLDNLADETVDRFRALETCYDGATRDFLRQTGVESGWRCLEIGAGGGSVGLWLSETVGPGGGVTVTDIEDIRLDSALADRANVSFVRHDIVNDALPEAEFDLIHARLVLILLPERLEVLRKLVRALRPGGWLVLEDFDCGWTPVLMTPNEGDAALYETVHARFLAAMTDSGADVLWARKSFAAFVAAGLTEIASSTFGMAWRGGSVGASLHRANTSQLADQIVGGDVTREMLERFWRLLDDPAFAVGSYPLVSVRGRRPLVSVPSDRSSR